MSAGDYRIADISLADFGRKELDIAEIEMPGLMECRAKYGKYGSACRAIANAPLQLQLQPLYGRTAPP